MAAGVLVPLEEYLSSAYEPDMDYDDGVLIERNVGQHKHSKTQAGIAGHLWSHKEEWGIRVYVEQRIQIGPRRYVVADICASFVSAPDEAILFTPPLFTIEILSPDDKFTDMELKAEKYLSMGVPYVWTVDPETGRCWRYNAQTWMTLIPDPVLRVEGTPIEIPVGEILRKI